MKCILCNFTISDEEAAKQNLSACPQCGTDSIPLGEENDVNIKINWHELRILTMWAEMWAIKEVDKPDSKTKGSGVVYAIAGRIKKQCPDMKHALTFADEMGEVRDAHDGKIQTNFPGVEGTELIK